LESSEYLSLPSSFDGVEWADKNIRLENLLQQFGTVFPRKTLWKR